MSVFIDTGVFVASGTPSDGLHRRGVAVLQGLADTAVTTDHVVVESFGLLARRLAYGPARAFWLGLAQTPLHIETVNAADLERARSIAMAWPDQRFSIVDCTSFAVMERLGCTKAAAFDADFAIYRYGPDRKKAFEIVS